MVENFLEKLVKDEKMYANEKIVEISKKNGIKALVGRPLFGNDKNFQIIGFLFSKKTWNDKSIDDWLKNNGSKSLDNLMTLYQEVDFSQRQKRIKYIVPKIVDVDKENFTAVVRVSSEEVDRDNEVVLLSAWKKYKDYYINHPVLLSSHKYDRLLNQIGEAVEIDWDNMIFKFKWYVGEGNLEADWAWKLAEKGVAMFSVGFYPFKRLIGSEIPEKYLKMGARSVITEAELYEVSQVVIGSNRESLQLGIENPSKEHLDYAFKVLKTFEKSEIPDFENLTESIIPIEETKPYPSEHSCRLNPPSNYDVCRRVNDAREHEGKKYDVIYCRNKETDKWEEQAYRYDKETWSVEDARKHCSLHGGTFEKAKEEGKDKEKDEKTDRQEQENVETSDVNIISPITINNLDDLRKLTNLIEMYKTGKLISEQNKVLIKKVLSVIDDLKSKLEELLNARISGGDEKEKEKGFDFEKYVIIDGKLVEKGEKNGK